MKSILKKIAAVAMIFSVSSFSVMQAQEDEAGAKFTVQGDLMSSYVWRGTQRNDRNKVQRFVFFTYFCTGHWESSPRRCPFGFRIHFETVI